MRPSQIVGLRLSVRDRIHGKRHRRPSGDGLGRYVPLKPVGAALPLPALVLATAAMIRDEVLVHGHLYRPIEPAAARHQPNRRLQYITASLQHIVGRGASQDLQKALQVMV